MLLGKVMIINLIAGLIKKILSCKSELFSSALWSSKNIIEGELTLSNYVTKSDLKTPQVLIDHNLLKTLT